MRPRDPERQQSRARVPFLRQGKPALREVERREGSDFADGAAPTALDASGEYFPALTGWAKFCRAYGAGKTKARRLGCVEAGAVRRGGRPYETKCRRKNGRRSPPGRSGKTRKDSVHFGGRVGHAFRNKSRFLVRRSGLGMTGRWLTATLKRVQRAPPLRREMRKGPPTRPDDKPNSRSGIFRPLRGLYPRLDCLISRARLTVDPGALSWTWAARPAERRPRSG
jgi:hypothetical protein